MEEVYHGSKISGLKELKRHESTHKQNWVYATPSRELATIFINQGKGDLSFIIAGNGSEEQPIMLIERLPGEFKKAFNLSGSMYTLDASNFKSNQTGWSGEIVSDRDEAILKEEHIESIYDEIIKMGESGKIQLYSYPDRPEYVPQDNSDLIPIAISWYYKGFNVNDFLEMYPDLAARFYEELERSQKELNEEESKTL